MPISFLSRCLPLCLCGALLTGCASHGVQPLTTEKARHDFEMALATVQKNHVDEVRVEALVADAIESMYLFAGVAPLSDAELIANSPAPRPDAPLADPLLRFALTHGYLLKHAAPPSPSAVVRPGDAKQPGATDRVDIGVVLAKSGEWIRIAAVTIGSAAEAAGLNRGDAIIAINGHATAGRSLSWCYQQLTGTEGSLVEVTVNTEAGAVVDYRIIRAKVHTPYIVMLKVLKPSV